VGDRKQVYQVLVAKPEGKTPFERSRHRLGSSIKMDLQDVGMMGEGHQLC
jgi:hypothetical protein